MEIQDSVTIISKGIIGALCYAKYVSAVLYNCQCT